MLGASGVPHPASAGAGGLDTFYYVLASLTLLAGFAGGMWRFVVRQRKKWTLEGEDRQRQAQAIEKNNEQLQANTRAIADLTMELHDFMVHVRGEVNGLSSRLGALERFRDPQHRRAGREQQGGA